MNFIALNLDVLRQRINDELFILAVFEVKSTCIYLFIFIIILIKLKLIIKAMVHRTNKHGLCMVIRTTRNKPSCLSISVFNNYCKGEIIDLNFLN